jgi:hypothetical protein
MANYSEVLDGNRAAQKKRAVKMVMHHVEIHPEKDERGVAKKGGGHTVHTVYRESGEEYGRSRTAEKPFGAGDHEKMLAHVANELTLPEPGEEEEEQDGKHGEGAEDKEEEEEEEATAAAH